MTDISINNLIHEKIREVWLYDIKNDYRSFKLLQEDSLKNAFYHHLRNRLGDTFLEEHRLAIYTEFHDGPLKGTGKRADLAVVKLAEKVFYDTEEYFYIGDCIEEVIALFEMKYKASFSAVKEIMNDVKKIKDYINLYKIDAQYYLVVLRETISDEEYYIGLNETESWAKNKVTELTASFNQEKDEFLFSIYEH